MTDRVITDMHFSSISEFCKSLPKIELHAHLNGSLSENTLTQLGGSKSDILEYQKLKDTPPDERSLNGCFKMFAIAHKATISPESVYTATKNVIQEFFEDNVFYLELRTTPRSEEGMDAETYVESIVKAVHDNKNDILVKIILSINRQRSLEECEENLDVILEMRRKYPNIIKGIDLSGNPHHGSFSDLRKLFEKAKENGLFTTIHCAEIIDNEEVENILEFHPDRLGHACFLHPNYGGCTKNWEKLQELKIPTEFCMTSNIITASTESYEKHHIQEWIKNNVPFSLNTDDKGVFNTSLSLEFEFALKHLNLSPQDLWKIAFNSIDHSFATYEEKSLLKMKLEEWKTENLTSNKNVYSEI